MSAVKVTLNTGLLFKRQRCLVVRSIWTVNTLRLDPCQQVFSHSGGRLAIPEFGQAAFFTSTAQNFGHGPADHAAVVSDSNVGALLNRDATLGEVVQGQAGDAQNGRFFLHRG